MHFISLELYEIYLPIAEKHVSRRIGFGAADIVEEGRATVKNGIRGAAWPMCFAQQFGEFVRVLRTEGGTLRYTVGGRGYR